MLGMDTRAIERALPVLVAETGRPPSLAEHVLTSRSALEGERKQVTVLFVDVSGFTSLSERLDPEDVHGLMNRALELMLSEVHRYEGTVNQFLGYGAEIAALLAGEAFHYMDAPIMRLAGPDVPAVPYSHPLQDWFMPNPQKIAEAMRKLAAY